MSTVLFALVHVQYDIWGWLSVALGDLDERRCR
jgi:hypothetical protein